MITGTERLLAAVNGARADRIPVFCNLLDQGAMELGIPLIEYYGNGARVAEAQLRMREKYGYDNVWCLLYVGKEAELLGCRKIRYAINGPPNVEELVIQDLDDIAKLEIPDDITAHPAFQEELKCLSLLKREVGGRYPICAYVSSSMTLPAMLMGMDKWFELLLLGPAEPRDELLAKCHAFFVKEVEAYRALGADVLMYSNPFGSTDTVPMGFFTRRALPWIEKDVAAVGTAGLVYYCGTSRFNRVIDIIWERTGIGVYYLSPLDDVAEGKRLVAGRGLTCGVINDIKMISWSPDRVRQETRLIIEAGMPGGRFLFGTGVMPYDIPEANIRAMLEAAYEYGRY